MISTNFPNYMKKSRISVRHTRKSFRTK